MVCDYGLYSGKYLFSCEEFNSKRYFSEMKIHDRDKSLLRNPLRSSTGGASTTRTWWVREEFVTYVNYLVSRSEAYCTTF